MPISKIGIYYLKEGAFLPKDECKASPERVKKSQNAGLHFSTEITKRAAMRL